MLTNLLKKNINGVKQLKILKLFIKVYNNLMIRIGVDGNEANVEEKVGVSVYALNILRYFSQVANHETSFIVYLKNSPLLDLPNENEFFKYKVVKGNFLWSQIYLPIELYFHKNIDVYFSPAHYLPLFCPVPQVVTIHDLAYLYFPDDFTKKDLWQLKNWTKFSIKNAAQIIAVSKTTKKDIVKNYGVDERKISITYNGYEKLSQKSKDKSQNLNSKVKNKDPFILFVGTIQPRKNLDVLVEAFNKFIQTNKDFKLIIVGKKGWLYQSIFEKVKSMDLENKVIFTGHVTDEELIWYYKNAFCLTLPSLYEGFGIPVLEAMNYGCPTILSMTSSLPEIGGDASLYFDPKNSDDLLEKLKTLYNNNELRKELISKGKQRIKDFSWEKCGKETLNVIKQGPTLPEGQTLYKIPDDFSPSEYNKFALHPLQTWEWGEARKKTGVEVLRLSDGKSVFTLTLHSLVPSHYSLVPAYKIGYLPRSVFPTKEVFDFLYDYGKKNKIIFFKIESDVLKSSNNGTMKQLNNLLKSKHPLFPTWTQTLDLTKSEDDLLKSFHSKTRYNIRLAGKKNVIVKEMSTEEGFKIFSKLYFDTCKRQKYFGHTPKYHQIVWESMKKNIAHILIAFYNDVPLASYELFYFKNTLYYPYGGTSIEYRNLMASNLLMWEAIKLGKKLGAEKFDMWGSLEPNYDQSNDWAGFTRFKEGYATKFTEFVGSYDLVINPNLYKIYNAVYPLRKIYLKLRG